MHFLYGMCFILLYVSYYSSCRDVAFLEKYARDQWEHVLHYLAGLKTRQTASHVVDVLATAGLVRGYNH